MFYFITITFSLKVCTFTIITFKIQVSLYSKQNICMELANLLKYSLFSSSFFLIILNNFKLFIYDNILYNVFFNFYS